MYSIQTQQRTTAGKFNLLFRCQIACVSAYVFGIPSCWDYREKQFLNFREINHMFLKIFFCSRKCLNSCKDAMWQSMLLMILIRIGAYQLIKLLLVSIIVNTAACFHEGTYEREGSLMGHDHNLFLHRVLSGWNKISNQHF